MSAICTCRPITIARPPTCSATRCSPPPGPRADDQVNLTNENSCIKDINLPETLLADTGYFSEKNVDTCHAAAIEPLISVGRDQHHPHWRERFEEPAPLSKAASPVKKMRHSLKTQAGRAAYGLRKQTAEPAFGIIKSVMGFRQFMLRGLDKVGNEWTLACLTLNLKRMGALRPRSAQWA